MKTKMLLLLFGIILIAPLAGAQAQAPIRVRCGGTTSYTDSKGQIWQADKGFTGGAVYTTSSVISGTPDPRLFQAERWGSAFSYSFPVANGQYHINLLFDEIYFAKGGLRILNVKVQGAIAIQNLDIYAAVGANAALIKGVDATVSDGTLKLEFVGVVQNAKVDGIEILPIAPPPPPPPPADTTPPIVTILAPGDQTTITAIVPMAAEASDAVGVTSVQFIVDNATYGPALSLAPYMLALDTSSLTPGTHTITASAKDAAGNVGTATSITVTSAGQLFDVTLDYDDGTPYAPGGTVSISEVTAAGTQSDVSAAISAAGKVKFRWPVDSTKTYILVLTDATGKVLQTESGRLPAVMAPTFSGVTRKITFSKATGFYVGSTESVSP